MSVIAAAIDGFLLGAGLIIGIGIVMWWIAARLVLSLV